MNSNLLKDQDKTNDLRSLDRLSKIECEIARYKKSRFRYTTIFLLLGILAITANIDGIKNAYAAALMYMGGSNNAAASATELHSTNGTNTLKVMQDSGSGHAIHAVNNGNIGDGVHAWVANGGSGVNTYSRYGAGIDASSQYGPAGLFRANAYHGSIKLVSYGYYQLPPNCEAGELAAADSSTAPGLGLFYCNGIDNWEEVSLK